MASGFLPMSIFGVQERPRSVNLARDRRRYAAAQFVAAAAASEFEYQDAAMTLQLQNVFTGVGRPGAESTAPSLAEPLASSPRKNTQPVRRAAPEDYR